MNASHAYGPLTERVTVTIDAGVFTGNFVRQWPANMPGMVLPVVWHRIRLDGHLFPRRGHHGRSWRPRSRADPSGTASVDFGRR